MSVVGRNPIVVAPDDVGLYVVIFDFADARD